MAQSVFAGVEVSGVEISLDREKVIAALSSYFGWGADVVDWELQNIQLLKERPSSDDDSARVIVRMKRKHSEDVSLEGMTPAEYIEAMTGVG